MVIPAMKKVKYYPRLTTVNNLVTSAIWKKATNLEKQRQNQHFGSKKKNCHEVFILCYMRDLTG